MLKETEGGREEVCQLMEDRITEEKIEMAKDEINNAPRSLSVAGASLLTALPEPLQGCRKELHAHRGCYTGSRTARDIVC